MFAVTRATLERTVPVAVSCGLHILTVASVLALGPIGGVSEPRVVFADLVPLEAPAPPPAVTAPPEPVRRPKVKPPRLLTVPQVAPPPTPVEPPPLAAPNSEAPRPEIQQSPAIVDAVGTGNGPTTSTETLPGTAASAAVSGPETETGLFANGSQAPGGADRPGTMPGPSTARVAPDAGAGITRTARPSGGYQVHPTYPPSARRAGAQGTTLLRVFVAADGRVGEIVVQESAGHADLDRSAAAAVSRWRFEPARRGSEAVGIWVLLPVKFELR